MKTNTRKKERVFSTPQTANLKIPGRKKREASGGKRDTKGCRKRTAFAPKKLEVKKRRKMAGKTVLKKTNGGGGPQ